jgi:hypothetical protein
MTKFILEIDDSASLSEAMELFQRVVDGGRVSMTGKQRHHCHLTTRGGLVCAVRPNKNSERFVIWNNSKTQLSPGPKLIPN